MIRIAMHDDSVFALCSGGDGRNSVTAEYVLPLSTVVECTSDVCGVARSNLHKDKNN